MPYLNEWNTVYKSCAQLMVNKWLCREWLICKSWWFIFAINYVLKFAYIIVPLAMRSMSLDGGPGPRNRRQTRAGDFIFTRLNDFSSNNSETWEQPKSYSGRFMVFVFIPISIRIHVYPPNQSDYDKKWKHIISANSVAVILSGSPSVNTIINTASPQRRRTDRRKHWDATPHVETQQCMQIYAEVRLNCD